MELCFIKRKVSNIVFELVVSGYKKISDNMDTESYGRFVEKEL